MDKTNSARAAERNLNSDENIGALFQPDTLLSDQYFANFRGKASLEPGKSLMLAVLEDGLRAFQDNLFAQNRKKRILFEEAQAWLWSDDSAWPFSFVSICAYLDFDPGYIRRGLRHWLEQKQAVTGDKQPKSLRVAKRRAA